MTKILQEKKQMIKKDDKYVWSNVFESELSQEDFNRNYTNLSRNIIRLKHILKELDIDKATEKVKANYAHRREISHEALKNFEKYIKEELANIRNDKENQKKAIQTFIRDFDMIMKQEIEQVTGQLQSQISAYQRQLDTHNKDIEYYKKHMTKELIDDVEQQNDEILNDKEKVN